MYLLALIITLALPIRIRTDTTFTKETPLLWTETKEQWSSGSYELSLFMSLQTPCHYLEEKDISWCENEFDEKLFNPLQDLCMAAIPSENQMRRRRKRWLSNVIKSVGTALVGVATRLLSDAGGNATDAVLNEHNGRISGLEKRIRFLDKKISNTTQEVNANTAAILVKQEELHKDIGRNGAAIEKLNNEVQTLERQIIEHQKDLQNFKEEMSEELTKLNDAMADLNKAITGLDEWRQNLDETLSEKIKAIGSFVAYFLQLETQMNAFTQNWRKGRLSDEFFDILSLSHNDTVVNEYSGARPKSCRFSKLTKLAAFYFKKNSVDSGVTILQAAPFRLHRPIPDTDKVEILSYIGPQNILYLAKSQCSVPFDKDNGLVYMPSAEDCHIFEKQHTFQKFWLKSCESDIALYGKDVQIQQMEEKFYIYCYGQDIRIYGHLQPCPDYVFSIHSSEEFQISKFGTGTLLKDQHYESRNDLVTSKINHRIFPNILQINFDEIPVSNNCHPNPINHTAIWTSITAFIVIVAIGAYLYHRHMKVQKDFERFLSKFKVKDGKGIQTMVREEVSKQLLTVPDPMDPSIGEKEITGSTKLASVFGGLQFSLKLSSVLDRFQKSTSMDSNDEGDVRPADVKERIKMLGVKVM